MNLLTNLLFMSLAVIASSSKFPVGRTIRNAPTPKTINVIINRCPESTIYNNIGEKETFNTNGTVRNVQSDFDETIRFKPHENGTIHIFVTGRGQLSVSISSEETVFRGLQSEVHLDGSQGGGIVTVPFEVLKGVRETPITVILQTRTIKKTVTIYASTKDLEPQTLRLDNISLNRLTARKTDKFVSKSNRYFVTIRRKEKGHIIFYVSGAGNKNVTLKSISDPRLPAKVMTVANNYAAFKYTTVGPNGEEEFLDVDNILVKVQNDQNEKLFFYLSMSCLSN